jgi:sporulation protein YlmC with PRC-barrel domain
MHDYKEGTMTQIRAGTTLAVVLSLAGLAKAQVTAERPAPGTTEMRRASQILGSSVQLNDGTGYGKVEDFVVGPDNRIEYLIVKHENEYTALPYSVGQYTPDQRVITYKVTPEVIRPLRFAPNAWPNFGDPVYTRRVRTIFPGIVRREVQVAPGAVVQPPP